MNTMKTILALGSVSLVALAAACSSSSGNGGGPTDASTDHASSSSGSSSGGGSSGSSSGSTSSSGSSSGGSSSGGDSGGNPAPPALAAFLIDRMGRPGINTALNHSFDGTSAAGPAKDAYNQDNSPSHWSTNVPQFEANLAILDAVDTVCGNQAGYGALGNPGYATMATVLSGDVLTLNTAGTSCGQYLALEFNALGVTNSDCGGRRPNDNVMDLTYNVLVGTLNPSQLPYPGGPATSGATAPASPASATFPYLASPH